eukprot:UN00895
MCKLSNQQFPFWFYIFKYYEAYVTALKRQYHVFYLSIKLLVTYTGLRCRNLEIDRTLGRSDCSIKTEIRRQSCKR